MDGNGRWATQQGKPRIWGHKQGAKVLKNIIRACPDNGITHLSVYAFSPENWHRSPTEVSGLMTLFQVYLRAHTQELDQEGVRLCVVGNLDPLPKKLQSLIQHAQEKTKHNQRLVLQIGLNYGGRQDLLQATQQLLAQRQETPLAGTPITHDQMDQALWTKGCPDPDLLIRTGGEMRLSNYMLWQLCYTELLFLPQYWPDFTPEHLAKAVAQYHSRQRRFGRTPDLTPEPSTPLVHCMDAH